MTLILSPYVPTVWAAKTIIMYSEEIRPDDIDSGKKIDGLGNKWKESSSQRGISDFEIMNIDKKEDQIIVKGEKSGISAQITLRNMHTDANGIRGLEGYKDKYNFKILKTTNLQSNSPRPDTLASPYPFFSEYTGDRESQNGVMFEFNEPVQSFGAWFGDLETRSDGSGRTAYARILGSNDQLITEYNIRTSTKDQKLCGWPVNDNYPGCGKRSTRWIGFVADSPKIKKFIVVVGDDDSLKGESDGNTEHISFIGPTIGYKNNQYSLSVFNDRNNNSLWDDNESPIPKTKVSFDGQEVLTNDAGLASFKSSTNKQVVAKIDEKQFEGEYKLTTSSKGGTLNQTISSLSPSGQNIGIYFPPKKITNKTSSTNTIKDIPKSKEDDSLDKDALSKDKLAKTSEATDKNDNKNSLIDKDNLNTLNTKNDKKDQDWLSNAFAKTIVINKNNESKSDINDSVDNSNSKKNIKNKAMKIQEELLTMDDIVLIKDQGIDSKTQSPTKESNESIKNIDLDKTLVLSTNNNNTSKTDSGLEYKPANADNPTQNKSSNKISNNNSPKGEEAKTIASSNAALSPKLSLLNNDNNNKEQPSNVNTSMHYTVVLMIVGTMAFIIKQLKNKHGIGKPKSIV